MTNSPMKSHFNPMTSASNDMNKIEEAAFDKENRKLTMLKECKEIRSNIRFAKGALVDANMALDVLVAMLSEDD